MSILPLDILISIIDILASDDTWNFSSLKACSLVCQDLIPPCQRHIFAVVTVNGDVFDGETHVGLSPTSSDLVNLLSTTPHVASYVRKLDYTLLYSDFEKAPSLNECLMTLNRLQALRLSYRSAYPPSPTSNFEGGTIPLHTAFRYICTLPSLTHLQLGAPTDVPKFPLSFFGPALKSLNLRAVTFADHRNGPLTYSPEWTPPRLKELVFDSRVVPQVRELEAARRADGLPFVLFDGLKKLGISSFHEAAFLVCKKLARIAVDLRHLEVQTWSSSKLSCLDEVLSLAKTITHISVSTHGVQQADPYYGLCHGLAKSTEQARHMIQTISVAVHIMHARTGDHWGTLDKVLTTEGSWPSLKEVTLRIIHVRGFGAEPDPPSDAAFEAALGALPASQFRRLKASNDVKFNFSIEHYPSS